MTAQEQLERAIRDLVGEYEALHTCEVSSLWIEHYQHAPFIEVTATMRPKVATA